jgi:hypothetical protein
MVRAGGRTLALLLTSFMVSCASGSGGAEALDSYAISYRADLKGHRYSFASSADRIVEALPDVYGRLGFPGSLASSRDDLLFISPSASAEGRIYEGERNSEYLDCGWGTTGPRADSYLLRFVIVTRIVPVGAAASEIEVIVDGSAHDRYNDVNAVPCRGTGKLEGQIANLLRYTLAD